MCELSILPLGSHWVLLDEYAAEVGRYGSEAAALSAARSYLEEEHAPALVLINSGDGEWRREYLPLETRH